MTGSEWVRCYDYTPPMDKDILMYYESNMTVGFYHRNGDNEFWGIYADRGYYTTTTDAPIYWMSLPEPPKTR